MDVAIWNDSYKTGHNLVDKQHQGLFKMVNELHHAILNDQAHAILTPTFEKLARYTVEHFRCEEELMDKYAYPAKAAHKQKHDELTKEVKELVEKFRTGKAVLTMTLSNFLAKWLRQHIKEDDMTFVKYVQSRSQSAAAKSGQ